MNEPKQSYGCDFCPTEAEYSCFACGKRFCSAHGIPEQSRCQSCDDLEPYGDTYRFRLASGQVVQDVSLIEDGELRRLLEMYSGKVRELETLVESAKRQQNILRKRLGFAPHGEGAGRVHAPSSGTVSIPRQRAKKSIGPDALAALADLLFKSGKAGDILNAAKKDKP